MKNQYSKLIIRMLVVFGAFALSILFFFILNNLSIIHEFTGQLTYILRPFVFGAVIAYLLKPICKWFEKIYVRILSPQRIKLCESIAEFTGIVIGLIIFFALLIIIIPNMLDSLMALSMSLPKKMELLVVEIQSRFAEDEMLLNYFNMVYDSVSNMITNWINESLIPQLQIIITGIGTSVKNIVYIFKDLFIGIIVSIYFLRGRKKFAKQGKIIIHSIFKNPVADSIIQEISYADRTFTGFIVGKIIDSAIIGVLCYVFCFLSDMPNGILVSVIVGVTNVIPFFGPYIGAIPSLLIICIDSPSKALVFLVFILVLQQVDGNIIGPKILGDSTGLSSFWVLFAIMFFGGLYGLVGMIIGVPLFAIIYDIIKKLVVRGLRRNNCSYMLAEYEAEKTAKKM